MMRRSTLLIGLICVLLLSKSAFALVEFADSGTWPDEWGPELELLREQARTLVWDAKNQTVYEIRFESREQFETVWPLLVAKKSPGGVLTLSSPKPPPAEGEFRPHRFDVPIVRIYTPSGRWAFASDVKFSPAGKIDLDGLKRAGRAIQATSPWPKNVANENGELPELVWAIEDDGKLAWQPTTIEQVQADDVASSAAAPTLSWSSTER